MLSRLAATAPRLNRVFSAPHNQALLRRRNSASTGRTSSDPAIQYSGDPEGIVAEEAATAQKQTGHKLNQENQLLLFLSPKMLYASFLKLESTGVLNQPPDPTTEQKRHRSSCSKITAPIDQDVSCAGLDGTPWPEDKEDVQRQKKEEEEDDGEYFKHHKASPLSEIQVVDTRKPITRATDRTADSYEDAYGGDQAGVILWRPEQLDTAEDSLRRAIEIWKQSAMRGDPDSPQSRVLRALRGEDW